MTNPVMPSDWDAALAVARTKAAPPKPPAAPMTTAQKQAAVRFRCSNNEHDGWPWINIPELYRTWGEPDAAVLAGALESLSKRAKKLPALTITGPVGLGKSTQACRLAAWMAADRLRDVKRQPPWDTSTIGYYLCLRMGWVSEAQLEELIAYPILVMDDLSGRLTLAGLEKAQQVIEERIAAFRPTIITSTLSIEGLNIREREVNRRDGEEEGKELGLSSRLAGGAVVTLAGEDRRLSLGADAKSRQQADP